VSAFSSRTPYARFEDMTVPDVPATYFRKGFGLKADVQGDLSADYNGRVVDTLRENDYTLVVGDVTIRLAKEFGFCYGVERAVEYAYQSRRKFPDRRLLLVGEIIHNPHVNDKLRGMGIEILPLRADGTVDFASIRPEDVVILPAFGVTIAAFEALRAIGCVLVDTTCGSVLNVWKRVDVYARDGYTALIHGKYYHEETRATASQVMKYPGGSYLIVRDMGEAREVCDYIEGRGDREQFLAKFGKAASPGFDPDVHLARIGVANQTTMLAKESLAIGEEVGAAMERVYGAEARALHFRTFDTICSATQERQDAVIELLQEPLDAMVVIGGYNSSNTISLAALCAERVPTFHIEDAHGIDPEAGTVHFRVAGVKHVEATQAGWLPAGRPVRVGVTAGASTPNNKIGETVARILATHGLVLPGAGA
jgi:4-hydroxy-3-methylbut-2-en-1-yl diphosphate reductase